MKERPKPGERPSKGEFQTRQTTPLPETMQSEHRRRKAVDAELAKPGPKDPHAEALTGKHIA